MRDISGYGEFVKVSGELVKAEIFGFPLITIVLASLKPSVKGLEGSLEGVETGE